MHSCEKGEGGELDPAPRSRLPPTCSIYGHLRAAGKICEIAVCKQQDIIIALFLAVGLSVGMWWVAHVAAESQTLVEGDGKAAGSCMGIVPAPCHPEAQQQLALVGLCQTLATPLPCSGSLFRRAADGQSCSYTPFPSIIPGPPHERAAGMLQQTSLPSRL